MGKFVQIDNSDTYKYHALINDRFRKVLALEQILRYYKFKALGAVNVREVFFDTPNNLLESAGVTLSKIQEGNDVYIKVEQLSILKTNIKKQIFTHKIDAKDTVQDHAFFIVDGIKGLYSTAITIDLENIIKNVIPTMTVTINSDVFKVVSGNGFRCFVCFEKIEYQNFETKRKYKTQGLTVQDRDHTHYSDDFEKFNKEIEKHCKDFVKIEVNNFETAKRVTQKIDKKQAKIDKKNIKQTILDSKKNSD